MKRIAAVQAREILDSRGRPTIEADVRLEDGALGRASVPSGASTGRHEALELRDGNPRRYGGRGVLGAIRNIEERIRPLLVGRPAEQRHVDEAMRELDGTPDKSRLGANAILAVSLATARACAASAGEPLWRHLAAGRPVTLPLPMVNILSGGLHAGRQIDFQDFLAVPVGAGSYREALEMVVAVHEAAARTLTGEGYSTLKADEGGFGPAVGSHREALELLDASVQAAGLAPGHEIVYALDVAASHFHNPLTGIYRLTSEDRHCTAAELVELIAELADAFPIASVEDALAEDDWAGWEMLTARLGDRLQLVGDDLFTTNPERLARGVASGVANAVLVKMNQIGTLTETFDVVAQARAAGYATVISARSGETEDPALADLAVGSAGGQIKIGSVTQSERLAKYNQLLRIEAELGPDAVYAGAAALSRPVAR